MLEEQDVTLDGPGARLALELVSDKWTIRVIHTLRRGTMRYGELQREIGGVSQKVLTQTLRGMERDGLIERSVYPVVPPRTEYSLTPLGQTLLESLNALCRWAEQHIDEVRANRAALVQP